MEITEVTRRDIAESVIASGIPWYGRLTDVEFLSELYDLNGLPSNDSRFKNASEDIFQHRVNNLMDWDEDWIFNDARFDLLHCEDVTYLRFLARTLHPVVQSDPAKVEKLKCLYNDCLCADGFELFETGTISGRSVFAARRLPTRASQELRAASPYQASEPSCRIIPRPIIYVVGEVLANWYYSHTKLNTLFGQLGAPGDPPPGNCIAKCQSWLFRINDEPTMDPLGFLGDLLMDFMGKELHDNIQWCNGIEKITKALGKHGLVYDVSGKIVLAQPNMPHPASSLDETKPVDNEVSRKQDCGADAKRFDVALSFPGDHRPFVARVAEALWATLRKERVFYDHWHEHALARPNLDTYLQKIYAEESKLVLVFLCAAYESKEWCGIEWRAIRELIKRRKSDEIMFIRLDGDPVSGTFSIDGYLDAAKKSPEEVAELILKRLAMLK